MNNRLKALGFGALGLLIAAVVVIIVWTNAGSSHKTTTPTTVKHALTSPSTTYGTPSSTTPTTTAPTTNTTTVPATVPTTTPATTNSAPVSAQRINYIVVPGDNLWDLSIKFRLVPYQTLYNANLNVVGSNPNLIYPHQVLSIP